MVVQFGWLFDAHHAGFLWAEHKGYYARCSSSVELRPGGLDTSAAKAVVSGAADLGQFSGPEQLLTARSEGLPLVAIAAFHRKSPHALISLERAPIRSPSDLAGRTVAVAFGDAAELQFRALLRRSGIPAASVRTVPFRFDLTPLLRGEVDAVTGFATDQPATLREQGQAPVVLPYYEAGSHSYGYMFFTSEEIASRRKVALGCFLEESRRGWQDVFHSPEEIVRYLCKERLPESSCSAEATKLSLLRALMLDSKGDLAPWKVEPAGLSEADDDLVADGQLSKHVPLTAVIDNTVLSAASN